VGAWVEDPRERSGFRWDPHAPSGDPTVTGILPIVGSARPTGPAPAALGDDLAGHLSTVTDVEWQIAHERLIADMPELADELAYTWSPGLDGRSLIAPGERDMASGDGLYDPGEDERFHGGGFRG
jgi:hypothetical protein